MWGNLKNGISGSQYLCGLEIPRVYDCVKGEGRRLCEKIMNESCVCGLNGDLRWKSCLIILM